MYRKLGAVVALWLAVLASSLGAMGAEGQDESEGRTARPAAEQEDQQTRQQRRRRVLRGLIEKLPQAAAAPQVGDAPGNGQAESGAGSGVPLLEGLGRLLRPSDPGAKPGTPPEPLDAGRLNGVIEQELAGPLVDEWRPLESLELRFDEERTDFARDRIGVTLAAEFGNTPWGAPLGLRMALFASLEDPPSAGKGAVIGCDCELQTDLVGLANFGKMRSQAALTRRAGGLSEKEVDLLQLLEATPPLVSLTDVADLVAAAGEINLHHVNVRIHQLKDEIARTQDSAVQQRVLAELAKAYSERDQMLASSIRMHRDSSLEVQQIDVVIDGGERSLESPELQRLDAKVSADHAAGAMQVGIGRAGTLLYLGAKTLLIEPTLRRIQQRDPATLEGFRGRLRSWSREFNDAAAVAEGRGAEAAGPEELPVPPPERAD